jgi:hypothetical protein
MIGRIYRKKTVLGRKAPNSICEQASPRSFDFAL